RRRISYIAVTRVWAQHRLDRRVHAGKERRAIGLEHAGEADRIRVDRRPVGNHHGEPERNQYLAREKAAVHPAADTQGLGREKHVLTNRGRLAERVIAGLPLELRQREYVGGVEKAILDPRFASGRAQAMAIVDDMRAATAARKAFELRIDELSGERDQGIAHVADRHE